MIGMRNLLPGNAAILCLLALNSLHLQAANVDFPDDNLADAIRDQLNLADGATITTEALEGLTQLKYSGKKISEAQRITSLEGLEHAVNLTNLQLNYHRVADLQPIAELTALETLYLYGNKNITDISAISELTNLRNLNIGRNDISDISPISSFSQLTQLLIQGNPVSDSTPIHNLLNLNQLTLGTHDDPGSIADISFVASFQNLTHFSAAKSNLSDISALASAPNLISVDVANNNITDISAISEATSMRWLHINNNNISDISPLGGLVNIEELSYQSNPIGSHDPVANLSKLKVVRLSESGATSIEHLRGHLDLTHVHFQNNEVSDISPLTTSTKITTLYFNNNNVSDISPLQNKDLLRTLVAETNAIADISALSNKSGLQDLRLRNNEIADASPLGSCPELWRVWLHNNDITTLGDWSQLSNLDELSISDNQLTDISTLGNCTALTEIYAQDNAITTIGDFSRLTKLKIFDVHQNQLDDLDSLATATSMTHIQFANNQVSRTDFLNNMTKLVYINGASNNIQNLDFLQNLTSIKEIYLQSNEIRGDVTLPDSVENVTEMFLNNNFITSISNLSALSSIGNTPDDLHIYNNYLNTGSNSVIVAYEQEALARVEGQEPEIIYTPQYNLLGDRDQDGIPDGWEIQNDTHPLVADSSEDPDADLFTNLEEFEGDTDPQNQESFSTFAPTAIHLSNSTVSENTTEPVLVGYLYAEDQDSAGGFQAVEGTFTWDDAIADSMGRSGHLASIISPLEQRFAAFAIPENKGSANYWIGGTDEQEEGVWTWITGEPFLFTNWQQNEETNDEPNGGELENGLELKAIQEDGTRPWNDDAVTNRKGYLLELNPEFALVNGEGDTHNHMFTIEGNELKITEPLDFESSTGPASIRVQVTDRHDLSFEQVFEIQATDVNEPSTGINLSTTATPEDRPAASLVAIIFTTDPDRSDEFTYALVDGQGSQDNPSFTIEGNQLKSAIVLDRETQATYSIRIRSTDAAQNQTEATFVIEALDMPENVAPNEITLSTGGMKENMEPGTEVFTVWGVDPDAEMFRGGIGTFSLVFQKYATLPKAIALAERKSGHPAVISSQAEWEIMIEQIGLENLLGKIALLGASDEETEGEWKWMTNEPFAFDNWGPGQPANANGGEHHLEILGADDNGEPVPELFWNDVDSVVNPRSYYILEQPMTYELVAGRGDTDNHKFHLVGNRLLVAEPSDYEEQQSMSIRVRVTDVGGLSYETSLNIALEDAPDAPTGILLSDNEIEENQPIRTVVANLTATDQDDNERHFFTLLSDSEEFYISQNQILTNKTLNYEAKKSYTLKIQVSDKDRLTYVQDVVINVTDANDVPTELLLSDYMVEENAPAGTEVATLTAFDPDINSTHTFLVVDGIDARSFRTSGDKLTTATPLDFEEKQFLEIVIRATDNKKGFTDFPVTIELIDTNDAPTDIQISTTTFPENLAPGAPVLEFTTTDQDPAFQLVTETLTWESAASDAEARGGSLATFSSLQEWTEMTDAIGIYTLSGLNAWLGATDEEDEGTWRWIDGNELTYTRWANPKYIEGLEDFPPDNLEDAEHHLAISAASSKRLEWDDMPGDTPLGAYILEKATTFRLVEGKGGTNNHQFKIVGNQLQMVQSADFETLTRYSILVEATDPGGLSYQKSFQLTVTDAPDYPTEIKLSTHNIPENQPRGYHAATLSATDQDPNERFTFTLTEPDLPLILNGPGDEEPGGIDNDLFYISRDKLHTHQPFDFEERSEYLIHVTVSDQNNLKYSQFIPIQITNGNDVPTAISIDNNDLPENMPRGTVVGHLVATDPDPNERHTFTVVGGADQDVFLARGNVLSTNFPVDYETQPFLEVIIRVTDIGKESAEFPLVIEVQNENDAPTDILIDTDTISENEIAKLISHWQMDGDGYDSGPAGNDGQLVDDAHFVEGGKTGWALKLDGDQDALHIPEFFGVEDEPAITISAWIKLDEIPTSENDDGGIFVSDRLNLQNNIAFMWVNFGPGRTDNTTFTNVLTYNVGTTSNINDRVNSTENVYRAMEWQHVVGVSKGTLRKVYIDGQLVGESNIDTAFTSLTLQDTPVDIGAGPGAQHYFKGMIDDVRLYATALSDEQVQILFSDELALDTTPTYVFYEDDTTEAPWTFGPLWLDDPDDVNVILEQTDTTEILPLEYNFELVSGTGDDDNHLFEIYYDMVCPIHPLNFEVQEEYSVRVRGTDAGGLFTEKVFTFKVTDAPDAPDGIWLDNNLLSEDAAPGSTVGILSTMDEDDREKHTFTLVQEELEEGDEPMFDNDLFQIRATKSGTALMTAPDVWFDFETRNEYHVMVEVTDKDGLSEIDVLTVMITDANDAPSGISIDNAILSENMPRGTVVGTLTAEDQDPNERHTFAVVGGPDKDLFVAKGNILSTNGPADFEYMPYLEIIVSVTDLKRAVAEFPLTIHVKNENDAPTDIFLDNDIVEENQPAGTPVGLLEIIDEDFAEIIKATAGTHSLFLLSDGSMYSMGTNNEGQLGDGTNDNQSEPVQIFDAGVVDIAAGISHSLCVLIDGSVWTFGSNAQGQLGDGTNTNRNVPTKIINEGAYAVWAGGNHSLVLMEDGSLYTFGANGGALGDGTRQNRNTPTLAVEEGVIDVAAKGNHSVIIKDDGSLWTFGSGNNGANGDGTTNDLLVPTKILDSGVILIAAGGTHTLFVKDDGSLWAFGSNNTGQLGNGNNEDQLSPVQILDSGVVFVEARANHSLFIKEDGSLWGMGNNNTGQLGVGDTQNRNVPTLSVDSGVIYATAGVNHSLFIQEDASLWGMGKNTAGELGDGTTTNRHSPVSLKIVQPTYELMEGLGDTDNDLFTIQGKQLQTNGPLDYEGQDFYEIRVKATDLGGLSVEQTFQIFADDLGDAPVAITLDNNTVEENSPGGTIVGALDAIDADIDETFTFAFVESDGGTNIEENDNDLFEIVNGRRGTTLSTASDATFNFEAQTDYIIHLMVTDKDGLTFDQMLPIYVTDANDGPTQIFLTNNSVEENMRANTFVGTLYTDDVDNGEFTTILSDDLATNWGTANNFQNWTMAAVDSNPNRPDQLLSSIAGSDIVNSGPGDDLISLQRFGDAVILLEFLVAEGANSGVYVQGSYEIQLFDSYGVDPIDNQGNGAVFGVQAPTVNASLPSGQWQNLEIHFSAAKFDQGQKVENARFDRVLLNGQVIHQDLELQGPTHNGRDEKAIGPLVLQGQFGHVAFRNIVVRQPGARDATFAIVGGEDAGLFRLKRNALSTGAAFDFEGDPVKEIIVEATDNSGDSTRQTFQIHITNANEHPTAIEMEESVFEENLEIGTTLTNIFVVDPDPIDGLGVYELIKGKYSWSGAKADAEARGGHLATVTSSTEWAKILDLPDVTLVKYWLGGTDEEEEGNWQWITGEEWLYEPWSSGEPNNAGGNEHYLTTWYDGSGDGAAVGNGFWNDLPNDAQLGYIVEYKHSYRLVPGRGGEDNDKFELVGTQLRTMAPLNYEEQNQFSILVEVTDPGGLTYQSALTFDITDTPDAPHGIDPVEIRVEEDTPSGSLLASLDMLDEDDREKFLIEFAEAPQGETSDNELFSISKGRLYLETDLDFETRDYYQLYLMGTDKDGLTFSGWLPVHVLDVNDPPSEIELIDPNLDENTTLRTLVGLLDTTDPDYDKLPRDLIAYYQFEDGTGVSVKDNSPLQNHGLLHNPAEEDAHWVDGKFGKGIQFGDNRVIEVPHIDEYMIDEGTFSLWFNPQGGNQTLFSKDTTGEETGGHIFLHLENDSNLRVRHQQQQADHELQSTNSPVAASLWHHAAVTFGPEGLNIYLNGQLVASNPENQAGIGPSAGNGGNPEPIAIGANSQSSNDNSIFNASSYFQGIIDEFKIYSRQLSGSEVSALHNAEAPATDVPAGTRAPVYTYALVSGEGDDHNDHFYLKGNQLFSQKPFDYETTPEVSIRVQSTDAGKLSYQQVLTFEINDVNDAPTDILLDNMVIAENEPAGTVVGMLSSVDTDAEGSFPADYNRFEIIDGEFTWTEAKADAESKGGYLATITNTTENTVVSDFLEINNPTFSTIWIGASNNDLLENWNWVTGESFEFNNWDITNGQPDASQPNVGTALVGSEHSSENLYSWHDVEDTELKAGYLLELALAPFQLVSGTGDIDNNLFTIEGDQLITLKPLNYEEKDVYSVRVRGSDMGGLFFEKVFMIDATDQPDAPTSLTLDNNSLPEDARARSIVGTIMIGDEDDRESFTVEFVEPETGDGNQEPVEYSNDLFLIANGRAGATLTTGLTASFDFETQPLHKVLIQVTDKDGLSITQELEIHITDANDVPSAITIDNADLLENQPKGTLIGNLFAEDPDPNERHTFSIVGGQDRNGVYLKRNSLYANEPFDFESQEALDLIIGVVDQAGDSAQFPVEIAILNDNDAPVDIALDNNVLPENQPSGTVVGTFSMTDPDGEEFTIRRDVKSISSGSSHTLIIKTDGSLWAVGRNNMGQLGISSNVDQAIPVMVWKAGVADAAAGKDHSLFVTESGALWAMGNNFHGQLGNANSGGDEFGFDRRIDSFSPIMILDADVVAVAAGEYHSLILKSDGSVWSMGQNFFGQLGDNSRDSRSTPVQIIESGITAIDAGAWHSLFLHEDGSLWAAGYNQNGQLGNGNKVSQTQPIKVVNSGVVGMSGGGDHTLILKDDSSVWATGGNGNGQLGDGNTTDLTSPVKVFNVGGAAISAGYGHSLIAKQDGSLYVFGKNAQGQLGDGTMEDKTVPTKIIDSDIAGIEAGANHSFFLQTDGTLQGMGSNLYGQIGDGTHGGDFLAFDPWIDKSEPVRLFDSVVRLTPGVGGDDNDLFVIDGAELKIRNPLNFEYKPLYTIRVRATDPGALGVEEVFEISVTDQPDTPDEIVLDSYSFPENTDPGTIIANLSVLDEDDRELHTIAFVSQELEEGEEDTSDNQYFTIVNGRRGATLNTAENSAFDYEEKTDYFLEVMVTDKDGLVLEQTIHLTIENLNEAPTDLELTSNLEENMPSGTEIGSVSVVDEDLRFAGVDSHTYFMARGDGDTDNRYFRLDRNTGVLTTAKVYDFESDTTPSIRIKTIDAAGNTFEKVFSLPIINKNDAPSEFSLSPSPLSVIEQLPAGTEIGTFSTVDVDLADDEFGEFFLYTLSFGEGNDHNSSFEIVDNKLLIKTPLVHRDTPVASIRVTVADRLGLKLSQSFDIEILNRNDAPTAIGIDNNSVQENQPFGTLIGNLSATDEDAGDTHSFTLVFGSGSTGNNSFFIQNGNQLVTNDLLDFESQSSYSIRVKAKDAAGATFEQTLSISVSDVDPEVEQFQLSVIKLPEDGGLTSGAGLHDADTIAALSATAGPGYTFAGWTGDLPDGSDSGDTGLDVLMDADKTLQAYFARKFHSVDVVVFPDRHGYAKGGGSILYGTDITVTAEELEGEDNVPFSHWRVNGVDWEDATDLSLTLTVEENLTIEAVFDIGLPDNFVLIPAGTYTRDSGGRYEHTATVSAFYTSTHETSKAEWYEVYDWAIQNGYRFDFDPTGPNGRNRPHTDPSYEDDFPITGVTWNDMVKWCNARSEKEGWTPLYYTDDTHETPHRVDAIVAEIESLVETQVQWRERGYRLPTELEWERAARGGLEGLLYQSGNTIDETEAFFGNKTDVREIDYTTQSSRLPNGFGLYDVSGNAYEATWDWYSKNFYADPEAQEPDTKGPLRENTGIARNIRTARGGSGNSASKQITVGGRLGLKTWYQYAITLRPAFPAPTEPDTTIKLASAQAHLGNVTGSGVYKIGTQAQLRAIPENGAAFVRWEDAEGTVLGTSITLNHQADADMTIYAVFEDTSGNPPLYTLLTFAEPAGSGTVSGTGAYLGGSTVEITATPVEGLDFAGWSGDAFGTEPTISVTINDSTMVTGAFGDTTKDSDKDGLSDLYEEIVGSNPYSSDSDGDKLSDGDEVATYGSDPTKSDTDGDGHDDRTEALNNTSLIDAEDFPFLPLHELMRYFTFRSKPYDFSGNKGHGTATDIGIIADRWDVNKSAFSFNGTTSFVEATGYNGVESSGARALTGWFRAEAGNSGPIIAYGRAPNAFNINLSDTGVIEVEADGATLTGSTDVADGAWHQFVVSVIASGTPEDIIVYLDGVEETLTSSGDTSTELATSTNSAVLIGKNSSNEFFTGDIDDIRLYERRYGTKEFPQLFDLEVPKEPDVIRPTLVSSPGNLTVATGQTATFTVEVKAKPEPTYSWQKLVGRSYQSIKGANTATLTINDVQEDDATSYRVTVTNSEGSVSTRPARLYVSVIPYLTEEPQDVSLLVNRGGRIYAYAEGTGPLTYQWFKDGEDLNNNRNNYYIPKTANQEEHGGVYSFKVTNEVGEVTSRDFTLSIIDGVTITQDPASTGILEGTSGSLTMAATGGGNITYQWKKYNSSTRKYEPIEGATEATYTIENMSSNDEGIYQGEASNGPSTVSTRTAELEMYVAPTFRTQPRSATINEFESVTLTSLAEGSPAPTYLWQKQNPDTEEWEDQDRYIRADLDLKKLPRSFAGKYRVKAMNPGGTAISNEVDLVIYFKPYITTNLSPLTANEGEDVTLTVEGEALDRRGETITFTWFHNKVAVSNGDGISGSSTGTITLSAIDGDDYGTWYCVLSNSIGETQSIGMKLTVIEKPYAVSTLEDQTIIEGNYLRLAVTVRGSKPLTYRWLKDGVPMDGQTLNKIYITGMTVADSGAYTFEATNPAGTLTLTSNVTVSAASNGSASVVTHADVDTPDADSDGDGLPNLLEAALGSDPSNPDSAYSPVIDLVDNGAGEKFLSFHYTESKWATNLTTIVEQSTDLTNWEPVDLSEASVSQVDRGDLIQSTIYLPASEGQRFIRIRVEQ